MRPLSRNEWIGIVAGICVVAGFFIFGSLNFLSSQDALTEGQSPTPTMQNNTSDAGGTYPAGQAPDTANPAATGAAQQMAPAGTSGGLQVQDTTLGTGATAEAGDTVTVNYTGMFTNGQVFDSSIPRGQPFTFKLGAGQVIEGWDQGVAGMKEGGKRHLIIPPQLGYGPNDYGPIPGNSTLIFDVELLKVSK